MLGALRRPRRGRPLLSHITNPFTAGADLASGRPLRVLAIGTDPSLLQPADVAFGDAHQRQLQYASILDQYRMIVRSIGGSRRAIPHGGSFVVHPSASRNRAAFTHDAYLIGSALHRRFGFDLVSTEDPMLCGLAGTLLRARLGLPLSVQIAGDMIDNPYWLRERRINPALNRIGRWLVRAADSVRVVSERERAKMVRLGVAPEKVSNLGWIADFRRFDAVDAVAARQLRTDLLGVDGTELLLFVGRLVLQKDIPTLIRSMATVAAHRPGARLVIAGDGPERPIAERMVDDFGIRRAVRFLGIVPYPDVPRHFAAADLFVLPSRYEGNARVLAEAGAAGVPSVTTDVSGAHDTVLQGETGTIVPVERPDLFAERVLALLERAGELPAMGARAREHVRGLYDAQTLLPAFDQFWRQTAARR
ncbi:MAG: glycosyltransferase family 4 protein [Chloroflexi bacterium]|nr:glycosyltransferase family 4 protein [Chloroflexota bacterium]